MGRPYPGAHQKECRYGGGLRLQPQATRGREALLPLGGRWYPRRLQRPRSLDVAQHGFFKAAGEPLERLLRHRLLGLGQAEGEVLSQELELERLRTTLARLATPPAERVTLCTPSPFALPLMIERLREQLSTEKLKDRLDRLLAEGEAALAADVSPRPRRRRAAPT